VARWLLGRHRRNSKRFISGTSRGSDGAELVISLDLALFFLSLSEFGFVFVFVVDSVFG